MKNLYISVRNKEEEKQGKEKGELKKVEEGEFEWEAESELELVVEEGGVGINSWQERPDYNLGSISYFWWR